MSYNVVQVVGPTIEPLSLAEAKAYLRVVDNREDALITGFIKASRMLAEQETKQAFLTQTFRLSADGFECAHDGQEFWLPRSPLIDVLHVKYLDADGALQTLDTTVYDVDADAVPGRVILADTMSWPVTDYAPNSVQITFRAGYGANVTDVPADIRSAIFMMVGHLYENRQVEVTGTITQAFDFAFNALLSGRKVYEVH